MPRFTFLTMVTVSLVTFSVATTWAKEGNRSHRPPGVRNASQPIVRDHRSPTPPPVVRDHRTPKPQPIVRDHRSPKPQPIVRDHRSPKPQPIVRDHRTPRPTRPSVDVSQASGGVTVTNTYRGSR